MGGVLNGLTIPCGGNDIHLRSKTKEVLTAVKISCSYIRNRLKILTDADNLTKINITYRNRYPEHSEKTTDFCL